MSGHFLKVFVLTDQSTRKSCCCCCCYWWWCGGGGGGDGVCARVRACVCVCEHKVRLFHKDDILKQRKNCYSTQNNETVETIYLLALCAYLKHGAWV